MECSVGVFLRANTEKVRVKKQVQSIIAAYPYLSSYAKYCWY
jgi:hypothetical protein